LVAKVVLSEESGIILTHSSLARGLILIGIRSLSHRPSKLDELLNTSCFQPVYMYELSVEAYRNNVHEPKGYLVTIIAGALRKRFPVHRLVVDVFVEVSAAADLARFLPVNILLHLHTSNGFQKSFPILILFQQAAG
jgi:hypothetical protein